MSKKETNSFIFEEEKIPCDFFDEDDEEDKNEIKKFHDVLTNSSHKMEEDDDNKDLNNITSVSETDKVYVGEVKDETKKSQESEFENEEELNETSLTNKGIGEEEEKNHNPLDDISDNNKINRNNNDNIPNKILTEIEEEDNFLLHNDNKKSNIKNKENTKNKNKNKSKNKSPIFLIRKIKKRSKKIQLLRKKKGLHIFRKKDPDTIRKKIKTYFHNYLLNLLNSQIKSLNIKIVNYDFIDDITLKQKNNKKKVNKYLKLNNKFTNNVSITANRNLLFKKISQILMEEPISSKYRTYDMKNNYYLTKHLLSLKKYPDIIKILYNTYAESYTKFLKSSNYQNILKNIKNKDGDLYMDKFRIVSNNFISYYINANKKPKFETKKKIFYKDKVKKSISCKNNKLNKSNNLLNNIYRLDNESQNNKSKNSNFKEIFDISHSNNNISLVEEFSGFFANSSYGEDKSNKEFKFGYKIFQFKNNSEYEIINNSYKKNINEFLSDSFEGNEKDSFFKKNEIDLSNDKKYEHDSFDYSNLSDMVDKGIILKKDYMLEEEDNSGTIYEKRTSDYSKTNESDYIQMKLNDITCKNDINNQLLLDQFKKFI
jgi:hypothetical protein